MDFFSSYRRERLGLTVELIFKIRPTSNSDRIKFCYLILLILLISHFFTPVSLAEGGGVTADYNLNYNISDSGQTDVVILANLHNPNQDVYISQYSLLLDALDPVNVAASDAGGKIDPRLETSGKISKITVNFNNKIIGAGRELPFRLSYSSRKISRKSGLVWEVNIPKAEDYGNILKYDVTVNVADSLGPTIYLSPVPESTEKTLTKRVYKYSAKSLSRTGAILSFGPYQLYSFNLKYNLKNNNLFSGIAKIALPPSIFSEQQIIYDQIFPLPSNVEVDGDGNYLATYKVHSGGATTVVVKGRAKILNPSRDVSKSGTFSEIPPSLITYTRPQKYWEVKSPEVEKIVNEVVGEINGKSSVSEVAQKLFEYTVKNLAYDENRIKPDITRFGALKALENRNSAVCMEFADLLVTLLRTAGIPAELLEGYANTQVDSNRPVIGDVLHSWVRLYVPRLGWVAVDPTWSNTTGGLDYFSQLDTNHFVFAIKGTNSETPYPAGAYKISPDQVGDIDVQVINGSEDLESEPVISTRVGRGFFPFVDNSKIALDVTNNGKVSIFGAKVYLAPGQFKNVSSFLQLGDLPPFGKKTFNLDLSAKLSDGQEVGKLSYETFDAEVKTQSLKLTKDSNRVFNLSRFAFVLLGILTALLLYGFGVFWLWRRPRPRT